MTGLDTNILVRAFIEDDASQTAAARRTLESFNEREPGFISLVTLAETVWVLDNVYRLPTSKLLDLVEGLLQAESLVVQNADEVYKAVRTVQAGAGKFADALIAELGQWAGCTATLTFDRRAARLPGMALLQSGA